MTNEASNYPNQDASNYPNQINWPIPHNGGQAFPTGYNPGMSLRDYFAGQALMSMLTTPQDIHRDPNAFVNAASLSYKFADAMLLEREKIR